MIYFLHKKYIGSKAKYDEFQMYGYALANIGLELERYQKVKNYYGVINEYLPPLRLYGFLVRRTNRSPETRELNKKIKDVYKYSLKLNETFIESNKEKVDKLKRDYISAGQFFYNYKQAKLHAPIIDRLHQELITISISKKKIFEISPSNNFLAVLIIVLLSILMTSIYYFIFGDSNPLWTFFAVLTGICALYSIIILKNNKES